MEQAEAQNVSNYEYDEEPQEEDVVVDSNELDEEIEEEMNQQALDEEDVQDGGISEEVEEEQE